MGKLVPVVIVVGLVLAYLFVPSFKGKVNGLFSGGSDEPAQQKEERPAADRKVEREPVGAKVWWTRGSDYFHCSNRCPRYLKELGPNKRVGMPRAVEEGQRLELGPCPDCCKSR